jgi:UPF0716 protein FxsA
MCHPWVMPPLLNIANSESVRPSRLVKAGEDVLIKRLMEKEERQNVELIENNSFLLIGQAVIMKSIRSKGSHRMRYFILLLIAIPAAEIAVLLLSGKTIGVGATLLLIIATGVIGAYLAKREGLQTIRKAQEQLQHGQIPGSAVLDGICILIGGILLLTPGFITDIIGFFLLFPPTRKFFKFLMLRNIKKRIDRGNIKIIR